MSVLDLKKSPRMSRRVQISIAVLMLLAMILVIINVFHLSPFGIVMVDFFYLYLLCALLVPLVFLLMPARAKDESKLPWYDLLLALISFAIPPYFAYRAEEILTTWTTLAPSHAVLLAGIYFVVLMEAARRAAGWIFTAIALVFALYPVVSSHLPGPFYCPVPFPLSRILSVHMFGYESIMGLPMHLLGDILFGYYVFAVTLQAAGAGEFFTQSAMAIFGKARAGSAKTAVISSGLMGSVTGSGIANVLTTGAFTIPAMKKEGLPAHFAGAVEACASSGGIMLPPVMGAVGFLMAQLLEVPYPKVVLVATAPAILFYSVIFMQVDALAARTGIKATPSADRNYLIWPVFLNNIHILFSIAVLVFVLFRLYLVAWAPWIATGVLLISIMIKRERRLSRNNLVPFLVNMGKSVSIVAALFAPIGMIMGSFVVTGLAYSFPYEIVRLAGGSLFLLLLLGATGCFILGMGVPPIAVYVFLAIVLAPGLVRGGLDEMAVHFFIVYCSLWATVTPPVAIVAFVAAGIAGARPMRTGLECMRLALAKYLLPFFFVLNPALVLQGKTTLEHVHMLGACFLGLMLMSGALERYMWLIGRISYPVAFCMFSAGFLIAYPNGFTHLLGAGLAAIMLSFLIALKILRGRKALCQGEVL
jgi:TRAP transporter 4TM/12TM fusion protein